MNGEPDVARANYVLNFELGEIGTESDLLNNACIFAGRNARSVPRFGTRHDHLAGRKNKCRCFGVADPHDHGGETLINNEMRYQRNNEISGWHK